MISIDSQKTPDFNGDDIHQAILNKSSNDKFLVILDIPKVLKNINTDGTRKNDLVNLNSWQFSPQGINIPTISIPSVKVPFKAQVPQVTSQARPEYEDLLIKFQIDNNFNNYHLLWTWLAKINEPLNSGMDKHFVQVNDKRVTSQNHLADTALIYRKDTFENTFLDYTTKIVVYALREYNEKIAKFTFNHAFLNNISSIDYDYSKNDIITCTAKFSYGNVNFELLDYIPTDLT